MKKVETYGTNQKIPKKKDEAPKRQACHICHGMGSIERGNGDTFDCPNRSCNNGFVKVN